MSQLEFIRNPDKLIPVIRTSLEPVLKELSLVILFGSVAKQTMTTASDIDVMVVADSEMKSIVIDLLTTTGSELGVFFDITFIRMDEFHRYQELPVVRDAQQEGIVIWEK